MYFYHATFPVTPPPPDRTQLPEIRELLQNSLYGEKLCYSNLLHKKKEGISRKLFCMEGLPFVSTE
jgi:hypothetical protein